MSDFDRNAAAKWGRPLTRAETSVIDAGLRAYMLRVYNYMVIGLAITGLAALGIYMMSITGDAASAAKVVRNGAEIPARIAGNMYLTPLGYVMFVSPVKWAVILAPLAMVFVLSFGIERMRPATAHLMFWIFAALIGLSLGSIFMVYTHTSITRVFFITAASFGALSVWGYTTQRDLSGMGSFLIMGFWGIFIGFIVNIWLKSNALGFILSIVGVIIFLGLTAYYTQQLKTMATSPEYREHYAILGALVLYISFINLFLMLLRLFGGGDRR